MSQKLRPCGGSMAFSWRPAAWPQMGYDNKCASYSRKETIDHCFLNCVRVKRVWSFFSPVLSSLLGNVFLPSCTRVFFFR